MCSGGGGGERHRHGAQAGTVGVFFTIHTNLNSKPGKHCLNSESTVVARFRFILAIHSGDVDKASSLPLL